MVSPQGSALNLSDLLCLPSHQGKAPTLLRPPVPFIHRPPIEGSFFPKEGGGDRQWRHPCLGCIPPLLWVPGKASGGSLPMKWGEPAVCHQALFAGRNEVRTTPPHLTPRVPGSCPGISSICQLSHPPQDLRNASHPLSKPESLGAWTTKASGWKQMSTRVKHKF